MINTAMRLFAFVAVLVVALAEPDFGRVCKPGEKGSPGVKYYLDSKRYDVPYPFYYLGCGGSGQHFDTKAIAYDHLQKDALFFCNGFAESAKSCGGPVRFGHENDPQCPKGHFCYQGPFFGLCCNQAVSDRYDKNRKALKCPKGSKGVVKDPADKDEIFFGKSCTHKFCPKNTKCVQEEFEAYCCL